LTAGSIASADCLGEDLVVDNQIVLRLAPGASIVDVLASVAAEFPGLAPLQSIPQIGAWLVLVPEPLCEKDAIDLLEDDPRVLEAGFNDVEESSEGQTQSFYFISLEGLYATQYAWDRIELGGASTVTGGAGVVVAIVDSGIDALHPVFGGAGILPGFSFVPGSSGVGDVGDVGDGIDNDGDGFTDESTGHGTHIAGAIRFVAPDAAILPVRVLDSDGVTSVFTLAAGIAAAAAAGADVVNVSVSSPEGGGVLDDAVAYAQSTGAIVVASAGNLGNDVPQFPAALPGVVSIASTGADDVKSRFSSFGTDVDLCAPGFEIVGPIPGGLYASWSGTSMSAGIASGVLTLARAIEGDAASALAAVLASADDIFAANPDHPDGLGAGRVNAMNAVGGSNPDLDGSGTVDSADLGLLLGAWGACGGCAADLDRSGAVGASDLSILLGAWGT
jgi:thermitase